MNARRKTGVFIVSKPIHKPHSTLVISLLPFGVAVVKVSNAHEQLALSFQRL